MKRNEIELPGSPGEAFEPELDAENLEFDFSKAPRPGRNDLFERAQGHFYEAPDTANSHEGEASRTTKGAEHLTRQRRP